MKTTAILLGLLLLTTGVSFGQDIDFETISANGDVGSYSSPTPLGVELIAEYPLIKDFGPSPLIRIESGFRWNASLKILRLLSSWFYPNGYIDIGPFVPASSLQFTGYSSDFMGNYAQFRVQIFDSNDSMVSQEQLTEVFGGSIFYSTGTVPRGGYARVQKVATLVDLYLDNFSSPGLIPVELTSFSARSFDNSVKLTWQTATELNNYGFAIDRSRDGKSWNEIDFVAGHGNSFSPKSYSYTDVLDANARQALKFGYRLRQIDRDGTMSYSNVVTVKLGSLSPGVELLDAYPNPFNPNTTVNFSIDAAAHVTVMVYDIYGRGVSILLDNASFDPGIHTVTFRAATLPSGTYLVMLSAAGVTRYQRIVLSK
jgi:hypothetical protein